MAFSTPGSRRALPAADSETHQESPTCRIDVKKTSLKSMFSLRTLRESMPQGSSGRVCLDPPGFANVGWKG